MKNRLLLFFFILMLCVPVSAQRVRIQKVLDSNLFETSDGKVIKLAGIDAPNRDHPDQRIKAVADKAYVYARSTFLNRYFTLNALTPQDTAKGYELVFLRKDYPLGLLDYNKEYLSLGYGRFTGRVPGALFDEYKEAEAEAVKKERGIWQFYQSDSTLVFDRQFTFEEALQFRKKDSLLFVQGTFQRKGSAAGTIASELVLAPMSGFAVAYFSLFAGAGVGALGGAEGLGLAPYAVVGVGVGYATGAAALVYFIGHNDNPNVTFWGTMGYSFLGAGAGLGTALLIGRGSRQFGAVPVTIFFAGPVLGAIAYANIIAPGPTFKDYYNKNDKYSFNGNFSHKDLYNSTVLYNVNLLNIAF
ncbi:MAG TPA: hypothetical protein VHO03_18950 [Ignavibacteriales bacterium]|nr:hypothetical protein [Ignavibacteriales bacterium]